jgi:thiamine-monophosphate kinase
LIALVSNFGDSRLAWKLGEFERINRFLKPLAAGFPGSLDLTDDAALLTLPTGHEQAISMDTMVEGVHFLKNADPHQLAQKLLRVNLSDLAAMGAAPVAYFLSLALPEHIDEGWLHAFTDGLARDQETFGIHLAGGDSTSTTGPIAITMTVIGHVPAGQAFRRNGAQAGDAIMVSGTVGDGYLGLMAAQGGLGALPDAARDALIKRYNLPNPRTTLARWLLNEAIPVHAAIDLSDGLIADLGHICRQSNVRAKIESSLIPLSVPAKMALEAQYAMPVDLFTGGDDYELIFTVPHASAADLIEAARYADMPKLHVIGGIVATDPNAEKPNEFFTLLDEKGLPIPVKTQGWQHGK